MKITVLGCGRWGSFLAWYLHKIGHQVCMWGRYGSKNMEHLLTERKNDYLTFDNEIELTQDLAFALKAPIVVISIGAQQLRTLMQQLKEYPIENKIFVLCMKGIEESTGKRLTEVAEEFIPQSSAVAIWVGPGHVQDFAKGIPNCMVIDSKREDVKKLLVESLSSELIRFYFGSDLLGNEIGAATKNVIGIAAGMLDGLNYKSLKGALMSRGAREISKLIEAMGGKAITAYGLAHLGDYEATVFSPYSRNRMFGEKFVRGEKMEGLAEGVFTAQALLKLEKEYQIELPICSAVYDIVQLKKEPKEVLSGLFMRSLKSEF